MAFHLDFESRSTLDLGEHGLDRYLKHESTQVLMLAYAHDDDEVKLWEPHKQSEIPAEVLDYVLNPFETKFGWNCTFEMGLFRHVLGLDIPASEWHDPMVHSRSLSLPSKLSEAGTVLGLSENEAKLDEGRRLIDLFCKPKSLGGEQTLFGISRPTFRDWTTDKGDWALFCGYCRQDVVAERRIHQKMARYPLPEKEQRAWEMDQRINARGIPVSLPTVEGARFIADKEVKKLMLRLRELTGLENPNSTSQFLGWIRDQGYPFSSLGKSFVARALGGEAEITDVGREVLEIRKMTSKSSISKYSRIADMVSSDGRLRFQFAFMGAQRTGRWSGKGSSEDSSGVQLQNLSRPDKNVEKQLDLAISLVQKMDYDRIVEVFNQPLQVVSSIVRSAFEAPPGHKFVIADLSAIEARGVGYLARCEPLLDVFRQGRDPYIEFACDLYGETYENLYKEWKNGDSTKRTMAKPGFLGGGYALGGGEEQITEDGDKFFSGLMGYSRSMQIELSQEEAAKSVQVYRTKFAEVVSTWYDLENAAARAIRNPGQVVPVGIPKDDKERAKFRSKKRKVYDTPIVSFLCTDKSMLQMILPSGRSLYYVNPRADEQERDSKSGGTYKRTTVSYEGREQGKKTWGRIATHGGKFLENCLAADTRVLTSNGLKKIVDVSCQDLVWDGVEWVRHEGVIDQGIQEVGTWLGIKMTKEHKILVGKSWIESGKMEPSTAACALSSAQGLADSSLFVLNRVKKTPPRPFYATAALSTLDQTTVSLNRFSLNAGPAGTRGAAFDGGTTFIGQSCRTKTCSHCGPTDGPASFLGAMNRPPRPTKITAVAVSHFTSLGRKALKSGLDTLSRFRIGISQTLTWIESTMTAATFLATCESYRERSTLIIAEPIPYWSTTDQFTPTLTFGDSSHLCGRQTPSDTISKSENLSKRRWSSIGLRRVYDLMNCGPRSRFAVMTDLGLVIVHNCCQAISRDVLVNGMHLAEDRGFEIVAHVHDEIVALVPEDSPLGHEQLCECMATPTTWAGSDFPLAAEGFESKVYRKG